MRLTETTSRPAKKYAAHLTLQLQRFLMLSNVLVESASVPSWRLGELMGLRSCLAWMLPHAPHGARLGWVGRVGSSSSGPLAVLCITDAGDGWSSFREGKA